MHKTHTTNSMLIALLLFLSGASFAQTTYNPRYVKTNMEGHTLEKVEITNSSTILYFSYKVAILSAFSIGGYSTLKTNTGQELHITNCAGGGMYWNEREKLWQNSTASNGGNYSLTFPAINSNATTIDFQENVSGSGSYYMWGIQINNNKPNNSNYSNNSNNNNTSTNSNFLTCVQWLDKNMDNRLTDDEIDGVKTTFKAGDDLKVSFLARFYNKKDSKVGFKLYTPTGNLYEEKTWELTTDAQFQLPNYLINTLLSKNQAGKWSYEWLLNGNTVYSASVFLQAASTSPVQAQPNTVNAPNKSLCSYCSGSGKLNCSYCRAGRQTCSECSGRGQHTCYLCNGTGTDPGVIETAANLINMIATGADYQQQAPVQCPNCLGTGSVNCRECRGMGYKFCSHCSGNGSIICSYCNGEGLAK